MICSSLLIITCAIVLCVWSVLRSLKMNKRKRTENGVPVGLIGWITFVALLLVCIPTIFLLSLTDAILITAAVFMTLAVACLLFSVLHSGNLRQISQRRKK
ncbi:MAG: hypothetical protein J5905_00450 [Prevotella sp.]|nr:hypothetical protein [Prevotella sp.]